MPSIESLIKPLVGYHPVDTPRPIVAGLTQNNEMNVYLRCPVPQVGNVSPDTLRQFDRHGAIPQFRVFVGK